MKLLKQNNKVRGKTVVKQCVGLLLLSLLAAQSGLVGAETRGAKRHQDAPGPARFAVMADLHLFDKRLGPSGSAFEAYLSQDPKLLAQSEEILDAAVQGIIEENVQFVLVAGDLTKDGEQLDHVRVAQHLAELEHHGIQVLVVPGNHDINNPDAVAYSGDLSQKVPNVSPQTFRALYHRFGFGQAIAKDAYSLSYVAEPVAGLWVLALDSCKYEENEQAGYPVVSGRLKPETLAWALTQLEAAKNQGKIVVGLMHHGLNQHFFAEPQIFPDFLLDDWPQVSSQLADAGLKVIFTGHYHSQDAAYPVDGAGNSVQTLCDVETGSLVMYPCAYRVATLDAGKLQIESRRITEIAAETGNVSFEQYQLEFLQARLPAIATYELMSLFHLPQQQAAQVAPLVANALIANYGGDENPDPYTAAVMNGLVSSGEPLHTLGLMLWGFWRDLSPSDNQLSLTLATP